MVARIARASRDLQDSFPRRRGFCAGRNDRGSSRLILLLTGNLAIDSSGAPAARLATPV